MWLVGRGSWTTAQQSPRVARQGPPVEGEPLVRPAQDHGRTRQIHEPDHPLAVDGHPGVVVRALRDSFHDGARGAGEHDHQRGFSEVPHEEKQGDDLIEDGRLRHTRECGEQARVGTPPLEKREQNEGPAPPHHRRAHVSH